MSWFSAKVSGVRTAKIVIDRAIGSDWGPDWISDLTNEKAAEDFIKSVDELGKLDRIDIEINSPGGDVASGLRIMNYLIEHPAQVRVNVTGMAASIAAMVMLAGDRRSMGIGTSVMINRASTLMLGYYSSKELEERAAAITEIDAAIVTAYGTRTGRSKEGFNGLLDRGNVYMGADEAIEWGFATEKDAKLKAVACADPAQFHQQIQMQGRIRAAQARAKGLGVRRPDFKKAYSQLNNQP